MSRATYRDRLIAGLRASGWQEDAVNLSTKYLAFHHPNMKSRFFVGKAGALRYGRSATRSMSAGEPQNQTRCYLRYLAVGDLALAGKPLPVPEIKDESR